MSAVQTSIFTARGWRERSPSKASALRALLSDGRRHSQHAMEKVGGMRFGARLFDLHNETDFGAGIGPLHYEKIRETAGDAQVFYRVTDKAHCDICSREANEKPSAKIARLEAENRALREENARLRWGDE
jgi:hypothetical protein